MTTTHVALVDRAGLGEIGQRSHHDPAKTQRVGVEDVSTTLAGVLRSAELPTLSGRFRYGCLRGPLIACEPRTVVERGWGRSMWRP
jgi:hypothetical protein